MSFLESLHTQSKRPAFLTTHGENTAAKKRPTTLELEHEGPHAVTPWGVFLCALFGSLFLGWLLTLGLGNSISLDRDCSVLTCNTYADAVCKTYGCTLGVDGDTENCTTWGCIAYAEKVCTDFGSHETPYPDYIKDIHRNGMILFFSYALVTITVMFFGLTELDIPGALQEGVQSWWIRDKPFAPWTHIATIVGLAAGWFVSTWTAGLLLGKTSPLATFNDEVVNYQAGYSACGHNFATGAFSRFAHHNMGATFFAMILASFLRGYGLSIIRTISTWAHDHKSNFYLVNAIGGITQALVFTGVFYCLAPYIGVAGNWTRDLSGLILTVYKNGSNAENWGFLLGAPPIGFVASMLFTTLVTYLVKSSNEMKADAKKR